MKDTCTKRYCFCGHVQSISWKENKVLEGLFARQHSDIRSSRVHLHKSKLQRNKNAIMDVYRPRNMYLFRKTLQRWKWYTSGTKNVNCDLYVTNRHMDPEVKKSSICAYVCRKSVCSQQCLSIRTRNHCRVMWKCLPCLGGGVCVDFPKHDNGL